MSKRQLNSIEKKMEILKARKQTLLAMDKKVERKHETRRKIIIGAISLKLAREDEIERSRVLERISELSDNDKKLFEGYFGERAVMI